ncbi:hypothetical protein ES703_50286 [subsurface metagenome]
MVAQPGLNPFLNKLVLLIEAGVSLGDNILILFIGGHVADLVRDKGDNLNLSCRQLGQLGGELVGDDRPGFGHDDRPGFGHGAALLTAHCFPRRPPHQLIGFIVNLADDLAVGRLDKAVLVNPPVDSQRADKTDIGPLRRLDRADSTVVGKVHVADLKAGSLSG